VLLASSLALANTAWGTCIGGRLEHCWKGWEGPIRGRGRSVVDAVFAHHPDCILHKSTAKCRTNLRTCSTRLYQLVRHQLLPVVSTSPPVCVRGKASDSRPRTRTTRHSSVCDPEKLSSHAGTFASTAYRDGKLACSTFWSPAHASSFVHSRQPADVPTLLL
jgi:hypothetical protein